MPEVKETTRRRGGGQSARELKARSATRTFQVTYDADSPPDSLVAVETEDDIPELRSELPGDETRKANKITVKPRGDTGLVFDVEVSYAVPEGEDDQNEEDPLDRPDTVTFEASSETEDVFWTEEEEPQPIVTSAGEPFGDLAQRTTGACKLVIEGNRAAGSINAATIASYLRPNAVNSAAFSVRGLRVGEGEAKFVGFSASEQREGDFDPFLRCRWEIALAPDWDLYLDDRGFCEADPANAGKLKEIVKGTPPTQVDKPWPLDGEGAALPNASDLPAELAFPLYPRKPFSVFGWTR